MTFRLFIKQLLVLTLSILAAGYLFSILQGDTDVQILYAWTSLIYLLFSLFIYFYAANTSKTDKIYSFNNIVVASFVIKLFMSGGFMLLWQKNMDPQNNYHALHYIIIYIVYTIYEVYFLTKMAKNPSE